MMMKKERKQEETVDVAPVLLILTRWKAQARLPLGAVGKTHQ